MFGIPPLSLLRGPPSRPTIGFIESRSTLICEQNADQTSFSCISLPTQAFSSCGDPSKLSVSTFPHFPSFFRIRHCLVFDTSQIAVLSNTSMYLTRHRRFLPRFPLSQTVLTAGILVDSKLFYCTMIVTV